MTGDSGVRMPPNAHSRAGQNTTDGRAPDPNPSDGTTHKALAAVFDDGSEEEDRGRLEGLDTSRAHSARIYDFWVGGRDHFAADRLAGTQVAELAPWVISGARGNRAFLGRAVSWLTKAGVNQFLDIGAGLPGAGAVHEVAQTINPAGRVAYVDNNELVLVHARALLACDARTIAVPGDACDPAAILADPQVRSHLDLDRPVAVLLVAVLHFIVDHDQVAGIVASLRNRLAPGSYVVISHVADLPDTPGRPGRAAATQAAAARYESLAGPFTLRTPEQITALFDGFALIPPGIVPAHQWRPRHKNPGAAIPVLAGIGHLPNEPRTDDHHERPRVSSSQRVNRRTHGTRDIVTASAAAPDSPADDREGSRARKLPTQRAPWAYPPAAGATGYRRLSTTRR